MKLLLSILMNGFFGSPPSQYCYGGQAAPGRGHEYRISIRESRMSKWGFLVIPAHAGIHVVFWIPAFAGMTYFDIPCSLFIIRYSNSFPYHPKKLSWQIFGQTPNSEFQITDYGLSEFFLFGHVPPLCGGHFASCVFDQHQRLWANKTVF